MRAALQLVIGNKNYSSWSLRAWFALRVPGITFEEVRVPLDTPDFANQIRAYSPTGRVPVLLDGALTVWDSLAIAEYAAEKFPERQLWPDEAGMRAEARCISAEMHSGFEALRNQLPMNARAKNRRVEPSAETGRDIARIGAIWQSCRERYAVKGPWLFGRFCIADAMYAPVVLRFNTYGIDTGPQGEQYLRHVLQVPAMQAWLAAAGEESEVIQKEEVGV